jgi:rRNA-processing protein FCF1
MKIIINDTNILIDLLHIGLAEQFFTLPGLDLKTTEFVINELKSEGQRQAITAFCEQHKLDVLPTQDSDLQDILTLRNRTKGLSVTDCSVWHFARKTSGIILTGDGGLRTQATQNGIEVRGLLHVFDLLLQADLLHPADAIIKLKILFYEKNSRLPEREVLKRVEDWGKA